MMPLCALFYFHLVCFYLLSLIVLCVVFLPCLYLLFIDAKAVIAIGSVDGFLLKYYYQ